MWPACRDRCKSVEKRLSLLPPPMKSPPPPYPLLPSPSTEKMLQSPSTEKMPPPRWHFLTTATSAWRTDSLMKGWLTIKRLPVVSDLLKATIKIYLEHRRDSEWFFPSFPRAMFQPKAPPSSSAKGPPSVLAGAPFHCDNTYCIIRLCWSGFENQRGRKQL